MRSLAAAKLACDASSCEIEKSPVRTSDWVRVRSACAFARFWPAAGTASCEALSAARAESTAAIVGADLLGRGLRLRDGAALVRLGLRDAAGVLLVLRALLIGRQRDVLPRGVDLRDLRVERGLGLRDALTLVDVVEEH